jgi:septal ring factor EnvC (AmiA/AmiB activator)
MPLDAQSDHWQQRPPNAPEISRKRALTHLALISAFLLPFSVIPYALARRRLSHISRDMETLSGTVRSLQTELRNISTDLSRRKEEYKRIRTLLQDVLQDVDDIQFKGKAHSQQITQVATNIGQMERDRVKELDAVKTDLQKLLQDRKELRLGRIVRPS